MKALIKYLALLLTACSSYAGGYIYSFHRSNAPTDHAETFAVDEAWVSYGNFDNQDMEDIGVWCWTLNWECYWTQRVLPTISGRWYVDPVTKLPRPGIFFVPGVGNVRCLLRVWGDNNPCGYQTGELWADKIQVFPTVCNGQVSDRSIMPGYWTVVYDPGWPHPWN